MGRATQRRWPPSAASEIGSLADISLGFWKISPHSLQLFYVDKLTQQEIDTAGIIRPSSLDPVANRESDDPPTWSWSVWEFKSFNRISGETGISDLDEAAAAAEACLLKYLRGG